MVKPFDVSVSFRVPPARGRTGHGEVRSRTERVFALTAQQAWTLAAHRTGARVFRVELRGVVVLG